MNTKFCKDCRHAEMAGKWSFEVMFCGRHVKDRDPVYGDPTTESARCAVERQNGECGPDGRMFEQIQYFISNTGSAA